MFISLVKFIFVLVNLVSMVADEELEHGFLALRLSDENLIRLGL